MATAPSANDLTRQQLDELDALLQRMLSLPLSPTDSPTPAPTPPYIPEPVAAARNWRVDAPATSPAPAPHLLADALPRPPVFAAELPFAHEAAEPVLAAPVLRMPAPEPPRPVAVRATLPKPEPTRASGVTAAFVPPAPVQIPTPPAPGPFDAMAVPPPPLSETVALPLWPLVALNWTFDTLMGVFGPPGKLIRGGFGKNLLGLAGIGLLLYTAAHVAQVRGWIALPIALPWPR